MQHDLVLTGFRLNAGEPPAKVLERVLGLDPQKARAATQRFPVILARTSRDRADHLAAALREAGAMVDVRESPAQAASAAQAAPARPPAMPPPPPAALPAPPPFPARTSLATASSAASPQSFPVRSAPALPTSDGVASLFSAAQPANDAAPAPANDAEPAPPSVSAQPAQLTAYQIGDLDLAFKPKTPVPASMPSVDPAQSAPLELDEPAPALPLAEPSQVQSSAPAPLARQAEAPAFGGMQTFGDGFDEMDDAAAPSLELDRDAAWLKRQPAATATPAPEQRTSAPNAEEEPPFRPPTRVTAPQPKYVPLRRKSALENALALLRGFAIHASALLVVSLITAAAVAYARSPDALFELAGLGGGPTPPSELQVPTIRPWSLPALIHEPLIHPLLRLAPEQVAVDLAHVLRARVANVHRVEVSWPQREFVPARDIECLLVEHLPKDKPGKEARLRVHELLRTGFALEMPAEVRSVLGREMAGRRDERGLKKRFTALCLAL